jgi:aspartyl/asparaginyl beta-hydroxylase (cupin superfamily)
MSRAPAQSWKTEGVAGMERPGLVTRLFMALVRWVERLNMTYASLGNHAVYPNHAFPWAAQIERDWRLIRQELDTVLPRKADLPNVQDITPDATSISRDAGWKIFPLVAYGIRAHRNIEHCPDTWRLVKRIPGLKTAMFSILEPGKHIPAHRGPYNGVLRMHLGLIVPRPPEQVRMRVGDQLLHWQEGRALIFDDAYEHEVWNDTGELRVVLFIDFAKPLRFPANLLNRVLLAIALFSPFLREGGENLRRWEQRFHGDAPDPRRNSAS